MSAMIKAKFRVRHAVPYRHVVLTINPASYAGKPLGCIGSDVVACAAVAAGVDPDGLALVGVWTVGDAKAEIKHGERLPG